MKRSRQESQELQQWRYHLTPIICKFNFRIIFDEYMGIIFCGRYLSIGITIPPGFWGVIKNIARLERTPSKNITCRPVIFV